MQRNGKRFNHRAQNVVNLVRQRVNLIGAHQHKLRHRTVGRRLGAGTAQHDGLAAKIAAAGLAVIAEPAGARGIRRDPLAHSHRVHAVGYIRDLRGKLVAQDKRTVGHRRTAMALLVVVQVRSANSHAAVAQQHHSCLQLRASMRLHPNISGAIKQGSFHRSTHKSRIPLQG